MGTCGEGCGKEVNKFTPHSTLHRYHSRHRDGKSQTSSEKVLECITWDQINQLDITSMPATMSKGGSSLSSSSSSSFQGLSRGSSSSSSSVKPQQLEMTRSVASVVARTKRLSGHSTTTTDDVTKFPSTRGGKSALETGRTRKRTLSKQLDIHPEEQEWVTEINRVGFLFVF